LKRVGNSLVISELPLSRYIWNLGSSIILHAEKHSKSRFTGHNRFCITREDFSDSTVSPILKKARNARTKTTEKSLTSYVEYLWQNSNYISKYLDSYWPSDVSTLICFRHTFTSVSVTINSSKTDQYGLKTRLVLNSEFVNLSLYDQLHQYLSVWPSINGSFFVISIMRRLLDIRTKTAEKSLTSYVELHICVRILIISASISTVIGLLMSARLYVLDIPFNNCDYK
jgi:hypothetical protein